MFIKIGISNIVAQLFAKVNSFVGFFKNIFVNIRTSVYPLIFYFLNIS